MEAIKQSIEIEDLVGMGQGQVLVRAEALVPGVGRAAVEALLADANLTLNPPQIQSGRIIIEGTVLCQAVYRQGGESTLRALTAQANLQYVMDMDGAEEGMTCRVAGQAEHVEARYENGHMVFQVTIAVSAQVTHLRQEEVVTGIEGISGLETTQSEICSVKLAAEASADALLREQVELPSALDARMALMEWGTACLEESVPDLGGIRVKGKVYAEVLISSGVQGRPVALLKYPLAFDQLIEVPEWLAQDAACEVYVRSLATRVEPGEDDEEGTLNIEAEISIRVRSYAKDCVTAITDAYATPKSDLAVTQETWTVCSEVRRERCSDIEKGMVMLSENAPGVGTILAVRALPNISGWTQENDGTILEGILEMTILYMPGGSEQLASTQAEMPFRLECAGILGENAWVRVEATSAEATALMSDRLEVKVGLCAWAEDRVTQEAQVVTEIGEKTPVSRRPGIVVCWAGAQDTVWTIGKRYNLPVDKVVEMNGGKKNIEAGKAIVLRV